MIDYLRAYTPWLGRAGRTKVHNHPWNYYLHMLIWWKTGRNAPWSEGLIVGLAIIGMVTALLPKACGRLEGNVGFCRFVTFSTLILTAGYSVISYNVAQRGIEWDVLPWCRKAKMPMMAYCPVDQGGRMLRSAPLEEVASRHGATPAQVALAWLVRQPGVVAIPKAVTEAHIRANRAALDVRLDAEDLATLDAAFPAPKRKVPLAMT